MDGFKEETVNKKGKTLMDILFGKVEFECIDVDECYIPTSDIVTGVYIYPCKGNSTCINTLGNFIIRLFCILVQKTCFEKIFETLFSLG